MQSKKVKRITPFYSSPSETVFSLTLDDFILQEKLLDESEFELKVFFNYLIKGCGNNLESENPLSIKFASNEYANVLDKIRRALNIPKNNFIPFKLFSSKKDNAINKTGTILENNNYLIYSNDFGLVLSILVLIRNALAHGNIYKCPGGFVLFSKRKEDTNSIRGILKISKLSDLNKIIKVLEKYGGNKNEENY